MNNVTELLTLVWYRSMYESGSHKWQEYNRKIKDLCWWSTIISR